jgi:hypothetical protein
VTDDAHKKITPSPKSFAESVTSTLLSLPPGLPLSLPRAKIKLCTTEREERERERGEREEREERERREREREREDYLKSLRIFNCDAITS